MPIFEKRKRKNDEKHSLWSTLISAIVIALLLAGLGFFVAVEDSDTPLASASAIDSAAQTNRIGLFLGHHYNDSDLGAVCEDGLTERSINANVGEGLKAELVAQGYEVDTFTDYGNELQGYRADLLMVIHVYGCMQDLESGYRISNVNDSQVLSTCLAEYEAATDLEQRYNASYMGNYPRFQETAESTPVLVIELGMLEADRYLLTQQQDRVVTGLANTINCFSPLQSDTTSDVAG